MKTLNLRQNISSSLGFRDKETNNINLEQLQNYVPSARG